MCSLYRAHATEQKLNKKKKKKESGTLTLAIIIFGYLYTNFSL